MPMIPLPAPPMQGAAGMPMDPMMGGAAPMQGMGPVPLPPVPAELAGQAAAEMVPGQQADQFAMNQEHVQAVLARMLTMLAGAANPEAEAAMGEPSPLVTPDAGVAPADPNDPFGGV